jgi:LCP family protein required for cell wall assembly
MASEEKPYRVYRGGRQKGKVPAPPRPERERREKAPPGADGGGPGRTERPPRRRRRRWLRIVLVLIALLIVFVAAWAIAGFLALRTGVESANERLGDDVTSLLEKQDGMLTGKTTNILLLGTDHAEVAGREADRHSDSIMLVRADGDKHRITYLSIPRDLYVEVPGYGHHKVNYAFQAGGPALALRTVRELVDVPIHHVAIVDFADFRSLIDAVGGITVDNPRPILSKPFDCPFSAAECASWEGWRFPKGKLHLDGRQALTYARVRVNKLDPSESDITRGERQQQVMQALTGKLTSVDTFLRLPFKGGDLLEPIRTDLSPWQLVQLGWVKFRTSGDRVVRCRLGGDGAFVGGEGYVIQPNELNRLVVATFRGDSAPQPPPPGSGAAGPGCVTGNERLGSR